MEVDTKFLVYSKSLSAIFYMLGIKDEKQKSKDTSVIRAY